MAIFRKKKPTLDPEYFSMSPDEFKAHLHDLGNNNPLELEKVAVGSLGPSSWRIYEKIRSQYNSAIMQARRQKPRRSSGGGGSSTATLAAMGLTGASVAGAMAKHANPTFYPGVVLAQVLDLLRSNFADSADYFLRVNNRQGSVHFVRKEDGMELVVVKITFLESGEDGHRGVQLHLRDLTPDAKMEAAGSVVEAGLDVARTAASFRKPRDIRDMLEAVGSVVSTSRDKLGAAASKVIDTQIARRIWQILDDGLGAISKAYLDEQRRLQQEQWAYEDALKVYNECASCGNAFGFGETTCSGCGDARSPKPKKPDCLA